MSAPELPPELPVAVIGAGPIGLAAAAHLVARGMTPVVFEAGDAIGHTVRQWAHVRAFSPWSFMVDKTAAKLLTGSGWRHPPKDEIPTGGELVARYLEPLAALPALASHIHLATRIVAVTRRGMDKLRTAGRGERPFVLRAIGPDGRERVIEVRAVIDCSGTWGMPNPAGADGLPAFGEDTAQDRIVYGIPDILGSGWRRYAGRTVMVVGSGHSALNALIELAQLRREAPMTRVLWAARKDNIATAFGGEAADALPARGSLGLQARALVDDGTVQVISPFHIARIEPMAQGGLRIVGDYAGEETAIASDEMIVATGFRPDLSFLRELRLTIDPWLESSGMIGPMIDPNLHSCGTVRPHGAKELTHAEPGFFIAGIKSYGRAPTFLLATGHEQVRSIVAALAGDMAAAARVELELPETGACFARPIGRRKAVTTVDEAAGCCGGRAPAGVDACCIADAEAKAEGEAGCGCGPTAKAAAMA